MDASVQQALQLLWGSSPVPVCAVDGSFRPVWMPDERALPLLRGLRDEMSFTDQNVEPVIPPDGTVLFRGQDQQPAVCKMQRLVLSDETIYLLQFPEMPAVRELTPAETRLLLRSQTDVSRNSVSRIMQAVHFSAEAANAADRADLCGVIREAEDACYALMNGCMHSEEMLWYASFDPADAASVAVQDLGLPLRQFAEQLSALTAGSLRLTACEIEHGLFARADTGRFSAALLMLFLTTHGGLAQFNEMQLYAERRGDSICIRFAFSSGEQTASAFHIPYYHDISLTGNEILLERFCQAFGASLRRGTNAAKPECTLCIPAAVPEDGVLPLSAAIRQYDAGSFSPMHVMLSEIMHAADFPQSS